MSASGTKRIRIIKHAALHEAQTARGEEAAETAPAVTGKNAEKIERRDTVAIVTRWVSELRQRKNEDAAQAFRSLFQNAA